MKKSLLTFSFLLILFAGSFSQTGIPVSQMAACDDLVINFLNEYNIPGATFALAKDGKLNVSDLTTGVYQVMITNGERMVVRRIMRQ